MLLAEGIKFLGMMGFLEKRHTTSLQLAGRFSQGILGKAGPTTEMLDEIASPDWDGEQVLLPERLAMMNPLSK